MTEEQKGSFKNRVIEQQKEWAGKNGINIKPNKSNDEYYVEKLTDNLFNQTLPENIAFFFRNGDGGELTAKEGDIPKMASLRSSSALCVNVFSPLADNGLQIHNGKALLAACGLEGAGTYSLAFEDQHPTGTGRKPANLDVALFSQTNGRHVFFESKFLEPFDSSGNSKNCLKQSYLDRETCSHVRSAFLDGLQNLKEFLESSDWEEWNYGKSYRGIQYIGKDYNLVDIAQLVKHVFGLMRTYKRDKSRFALVYIYFDDEQGLQKKELESFQALLEKDGVCFRFVSYQTFIAKLNEVSVLNPKHKKYLKDRYNLG